MDFGLALTKGSHRVTYSNLSATMGTPDYMAPEQIEGQRGDQRTDVYALGTILYELLAGKTPFTGDTNMAIMAQHLNGTAPRLDKVNPSVTPQIAAIVATCLARNPEDRYADMNALIEALDHPENVDISVLEKLSTPPTPTAPSLANMQTLQGILIAIGIMGVLVLLALGLQFLNR
jgi:serine/threonine-protein kinase